MPLTTSTGSHWHVQAAEGAGVMEEAGVADLMGEAGEGGAVAVVDEVRLSFNP